MLARSAPAKPGSPGKKQASRDAQKVLRLLAKKLQALGFQRTKVNFFTRPAPFGLEFVHTHKFSFAPAFRLHFGLRVRSDDFPGVHLNGPSSDEIGDPVSRGQRRYRFDFDASASSWESCAQAMCQCTSAEGLDWFAAMRKLQTLLGPGSPLMPQAPAALRWELDNPSLVQASEQTRRLLNGN